MIMKLRADWTAKKYPASGERTGWKDFHNEFPSYSRPPIPLVRKAMMQDEATKATF